VAGVFGNVEIEVLINLQQDIGSAPNEQHRIGSPERSVDRDSAVDNGPNVSFWIRELPFVFVLIVTFFGVAYTSLLKQPIMIYWELLAPVIGAVCIIAGWPKANGKNARIKLIIAQALHWTAFVLVMNMIALPSVEAILNANATGLAVLMLLALGTFTAGVHTLSWRICLLGIIMAFCVPAAAWIEASALIVALISMAVLGISVVLWLLWHESHSTTSSERTIRRRI
jgi:hypothetical protein